MALETLPLLRNGEEYLSSDKKPMFSINGERLLDVSFAPELHVQMAIPINKMRGYNLLQKLSIDDLISIYVEAGKIFFEDMDIQGVNTNIDEWSELITLATGMPITFVKNSMMLTKHFFQKSELKRFLEANSPTGNIDIFDNNVDFRGSTMFGYSPRGRNVGIALPGNHPAVALLGLVVPLFKIPTIIRSSSSEPFMSYRLCKALWEAGIPSESLFHFVTDHSVVDSLLRKSDLGIVFGSEWTQDLYGDDSKIKVFGPGRSKVVVDFDKIDSLSLDLALSTAYESISADGGRGCINASGIIYNTPNGYDNFISNLAQKMSSSVPLDPLDPQATIPAMNINQAKSLYAFIQSRISPEVNDITSLCRGSKDFLSIQDDLAFLLPTLLEVKETSLVRNDEYPFAFGTIVKPHEYESHELAKDSLSVSYLTDDPHKVKKYLIDPTIKKVFLNQLTFNVDLAAPHEGFYSDFLYQSKATNIKF